MGHSCVRIKVRRRRVAILAARSKQFDVKNHMNKLGNVEVVEFKYNDDSTPIKATKQRGKIYVQQGFNPIYLPRGVDSNGNEKPPFKIKQHGYYLEVSDKPDKMGMRFHLPDHSWKYERHKQPKRLIRSKKRKHTGENWVVNGVGGYMRAYDTKCEKRNDFVEFFPNYPYNLPKMNKVEYMEKLVQHKLAKWERKNPQPAEKDDMFKEEFVTPWLAERNKAEERIRDFVVSVYDKLPVMGNIVDRVNKKMKSIKIGEVKDIDGKGHNVNHPNLSPNDKLYKHAEAVAMNAMKIDKRILDADLLNHKHDQKRPLNVHRQPIDVKKVA